MTPEEAGQTVEPVAEVVKATGALKDIHIIRWLNDYSPNEGDKLYPAPASEQKVEPEYKPLGPAGKEDQAIYDSIARNYAPTNNELRQICRDAYEVWAGSDGIPMPETAAEAYLYELLIKMKDEVKRGLK